MALGMVNYFLCLVFDYFLFFLLFCSSLSLMDQHILSKCASLLNPFGSSLRVPVFSFLFL